MIDMNLQRFASRMPPMIPNELPDTPGPKLVSAKGTVERLVVVLEEDENLQAATARVLKAGNVPVVATTECTMTWAGGCYIGFAFNSGTELGIYVRSFDEQGSLVIGKYTATIAQPK